MTDNEKTEEWQIRIREVQGAICVASIFQVFLGYFGSQFIFLVIALLRIINFTPRILMSVYFYQQGIIGLVLDYITPMTIAPAVALIGLSLFQDAAEKASGNWGIATV